VTSADVRPGAKFGGEAHPEHPVGEAVFAGGTSDLSHVLVYDAAGLTSTKGDEGGLYEWPPRAGGELQLVSIRPESEGGKPASTATEIPQPGSQESGRNAISEDGSRVFWSDKFSPERLYLRDMVKGETLRIGTAAYADRFEVANRNGSRVFFIAEETHKREGTLEVCDVVEIAAKLACETTVLAPEVQGGVIGASEDESYVYFVSEAKLAADAEEHKYNLYVDHYSGTSWETQLITTLPEEDEHDWSSFLSHLTARVSPNGRWLAFMSRKSLTGYDNRDAVSGVPDEEVYLYNAEDQRLVCASCDPTGARPLGSEYGEEGAYYQHGILGGGNGVWEPTTWLAANIQGWDAYAGEAYPVGAEDLYQSRYLSNEGRLFFNSGDSLVPQDVNGTWDVYEYEPESVGSCSPASSSGSVVFKPNHSYEVEGRKGEEDAGCVGLISSGESSEQSAFMDASESGDDVFFLTTSRLVPQDVDTYPDIYDAHVCSTSVPCQPSSVSPPSCDTADACRAAPTPQPEVFGAPTTATFAGAGNIEPQTGPPAKPAVKKKTVKCKKGDVKNKRGKCVPKKKSKKRAKRASRNLRSKS
jgi:hypothetical protein